MMMGITGPNISSFITGSSSVTPVRIVGSIRRVERSRPPPNAIRVFGSVVVNKTAYAIKVMFVNHMGIVIALQNALSVVLQQIRC